MERNICCLSSFTVRKNSHDNNDDDDDDFGIIITSSNNGDDDFIRRRNFFYHNRLRFTTTKIFIFITILLSSLPLINSASSECTFPEHWLGSWFQKGVTETIHISRNNISEKGICRKNHGEKYLIENRLENCVRCLVISERHTNILQYKETFNCYPLSSMTLDHCFDINGDAPLYSLFRVNTSPIKCPFNGPFTFSYSKGILNECKDPPSTIDRCTDDRRMLFKFTACIDIPGSESKVEELECIADWKENSIRYLVGKLYHKSATTDEDRFRCFVIEKNTTDPSVESYNIGQSGDASCEGLFSPRDGSRTFKLRRAPQVEPGCQFSPWLVTDQWTTLDNRHRYDFSALNQLTVWNEKREVHQTAKCIDRVDIPDNSASMNGFNVSRFTIHTTVQCSNGYACMIAYQRENRIVELQFSNVVSKRADACSGFNFDGRQSASSIITLTRPDQETRPCHLSGIFSIRSKMSFYNSRLVSLLDSRFMCQEKALKLKSHCDDPDQFQFICSTDNRVKNFRCRGSWRENNTQYMLVSFMEKFNYEYCIAYNRETNDIRIIRNSHFCYRDIMNRPTTSMQPYQSPVAESHGNDLILSFTLINEGSCQRSSGRSNHRTMNWPFSVILIVMIVLF